MPFGEVTVINLASVFGTVLTVAGLVIAIVQVNETKELAKRATRAAEAAQQAAERAGRELSGHQLIALFPQLHSLELELGLAVRDKDNRGAYRVLHLWRQSAIQVEALMTRLGIADDTMLRLISTSNTLASVAGSGLLRDPPPVPLEATEKVRTSISKVCNQLGPLVAALEIRSQEEEFPRVRQP